MSILNAGMVALDSSFIAAAGYNEWTRTLVIKFHSGLTREYHGVHASVFSGLINATSPGGFFNQQIRGRYS